MENTTLAVVVTDAVLTKPQAKRLAMIAQTGFARAIYPVHAPLDGDVVFAAATCEKPIDPLVGLTELGMVAANVVARAIARGVYSATALPFPGALPAWQIGSARNNISGNALPWLVRTGDTPCRRQRSAICSTFRRSANYG